MTPRSLSAAPSDRMTVERGPASNGVNGSEPESAHERARRLRPSRVRFIQRRIEERGRRHAGTGGTRRDGQRPVRDPLERRAGSRGVRARPCRRRVPRPLTRAGARAPQRQPRRRRVRRAGQGGRRRPRAVALPRLVVRHAGHPQGLGRPRVLARLRLRRRPQVRARPLQGQARDAVHHDGHRVDAVRARRHRRRPAARALADPQRHAGLHRLHGAAAVRRVDAGARRRGGARGLSHRVPGAPGCAGRARAAVLPPVGRL